MSYLLIKTLPDVYIEPPYEYEVSDEEFNSWCDAHNYHGAVANSCVKKILMNMVPGETFAEASARLGYGNNASKETRKWYYDRGIAFMGSN